MEATKEEDMHFKQVLPASKLSARTFVKTSSTTQIIKLTKYESRKILAFRTVDLAKLNERKPRCHDVLKVQ
ncbi:hypothetical protein RUM43_004477 [Polyplax serrata]|uniref:Uncharacterized protein n=1 Tax=Polyplax serrata TaxID=468196 RepID=A0AAN8SAW2_POLSC